MGTVSYESARQYSEPQPGHRWIEYELPSDTLQTIPNSDRLTPPPPYIPLQEAELPPLPPPPVIELSEEQRRVLRLVESGKNIFFTGPAGKLACPLFKIRNECITFQEPENQFY